MDTPRDDQDDDERSSDEDDDDDHDRGGREETYDALVTQRQEMVENLIAMGFPVDWALRATGIPFLSSSLHTAHNTVDTLKIAMRNFYDNL